MPSFTQVSGAPCGRENLTCGPSAGTWKPTPGALDGNHPGAPQHKCGPKHTDACPVAKTPVCAGNTFHGTQHFVYTGPKPMPAWVPAPGTMKMDPRSTQCIKSHHDNATNTTICDVPFGARSMCGEEATTRATICDSALRSESRHDQPAPRCD